MVTDGLLVFVTLQLFEYFYFQDPGHFHWSVLSRVLGGVPPKQLSPSKYAELVGRILQPNFHALSRDAAK